VSSDFSPVATGHFTSSSQLPLFDTSDTPYPQPFPNGADGPIFVAAIKFNTSLTL
jgi:hypothetical protein